MVSTRFVPGSHTALALAVCLGLISPALTWADESTDRPRVTSSVPDHLIPDVKEVGSRPRPGKEPSEDSSREQIQEAADYLLSGLAETVQSLVFTMAISPWTANGPTVASTPVPDDFVTMTIKAPVPSSDIPNSPANNPPPTQQSPEPGTLIGGLAGVCAMLYRYHRRRRAKAEAVESEEMIEEGEVEFAMGTT